MITGFRNTGCTTVGTMHEFIWGADNEETGTIWLGVVNLKKESLNILDYMEGPLIDKIQGRFTNTDWINVDYDALMLELDDIYTTNKDSTSTSPDP